MLPDLAARAWLVLRHLRPLTPREGCVSSDSIEAGGVPALWPGVGDSDDRCLAELHALLGDGDAERGCLRLALWLALGFLPSVPSYVRTTHALWTPDSGWTRRRGPVSARLLLGHFRGEWALGGVHACETQVVACDIDNQAGKRDGRGVAHDVDLDARVDVVRRAFPRAVWCRSSATGGLHAWTFLDEPHPVRVLLHLARARLASAAVGVRGVAERLAAAPVGGVPGFLELLPLAFGQGGVIRAPLGPGSVLLDDSLCPVALSPGAAVTRWIELVGQRRVDLLAAFRSPLPAPVPRGIASGDAEPTLGDLPTAPTRVLPPRDERRTPRGRRASVVPSDCLALLRQCDGRVPAFRRAGRAGFWQLVHWLWHNGLPGPSTRHAATFALALACRWQRLSREAAETRLLDWFEARGHRQSQEWTRQPHAAARKTRSIVRHVYRPEAPKPRCRRPRHQRPGTVSLADQQRLMRLFPHDPLAVDVALAILRWARTNAYALDAQRVVCEIPMRALGITTRRRRAAWQRVHDSCAVLRLYGARVAPRALDHPAGPRRARAARYTIVWAYSERGPRIRGRRALTSRREGYLVGRLGVGSRSASTVRRAVPCEALRDAVKESASGSLPLPGETGVSAACGRCACGRIRSRPHASRCGKRAAFSKGLWTDDPRGLLRRSVHRPVSGGSVHRPPGRGVP